MPHSQSCRFIFDDGVHCSNLTTSHSVYCDQHSDWLAVDLEVYKVMASHFDQDLREYWTKNNFYLVVEVGLMSVFVTAVDQHSVSDRPIIIALGVFGLLLTVMWSMVAKGSLFWIRKWRAQMLEADKLLDRHGWHSTVEGMVQKNPLLSPSALTRNLPRLFFLGWVVLLGIVLLGPHVDAIRLPF